MENKINGSGLPVGSFEKLHISAISWLAITLLTIGAWGTNAFAQSGSVAVVWGSPISGKTNIPPAATNLISLAAGSDHILALRVDGGVVGWGLNNQGQTNSPASATNISLIASGYDHNLALRNDGMLVGWGNNAYGKATIPSNVTNQPIAAIAAGTSHNLILRTDGTVFAWGINSFSTTNIPARATNGMRIAAGHTSSGGGHNLLLRRDGTVVSWGYSVAGQTNPPVAASNLVAVSAGSTFSLGLRADGNVVGWGDNGQITVPINATSIVAIAAGNSHSVALRSDGNIVSWGNNSSGQRNLPAIVSNSVAVAVFAGNQYTGCLLGDGSPVFVDALGDLVAYRNKGFTLNALAVGAPPLSYQWKFNGVEIPAATAGTYTFSSVQSSNAGVYSVVVSNTQGVVTGVVANVSVAIMIESPKVLTPPQSQSVNAGSNVVFDVTASGYPEPSFQWQFGSTNITDATNSSYAIPYVVSSQAGNYRVVLSNNSGMVTSQIATLTVTLPEWPALDAWPASRAVSYGSPLTLSVTPAANTGPVSYSWQFNGTNLPDVGGPTLTFSAFPPGDGGVYRVAVSNQFGGSVSPEFEIAAVPVAAWGSIMALTNLPRALTNAVAISVGLQHAVAIKADGTLSAWGENQVTTGYFPPFKTNNYPLTEIPPGLSNVVAVAAGAYHTVAVRSDGVAFAWGRNDSGQTNVPPAATNIIAVAAGDAHSVALRADGTLIAWGTNNTGQLNIPLDATNIVAIAAGSAHTVALRGDGRVLAWGTTISSVTNIPATATDVVAISAKAAYSVAIRADGTRVTWGNSIPTQSVFPSYGFPSTDNQAAAAGNQHVLYLNSTGIEPFYTSIFGNDARLTPPKWLQNVVGIAAGNVSFALMKPEAGLPVLQVAQRQTYIQNPTVFSAHVEGQRALTPINGGSYQWRFNGTNLLGATNRALVLPSTTLTQAGDYTVVATDGLGAVTSQEATLVVTPPPLPALALQPSGKTVGAGSTATFSAALAYGVPGQFQWQFNGTNLAGAVGASLILSNVQAMAAGEYRVIATNLSGSITSQPAMLVVTSTPPTIVMQPENLASAVGIPAVLSVDVVGATPLSYQWQFNGSDLMEATNAALVLLKASLTNGGEYRVVITNISGAVTSNPALLTISPVAAWGSNTGITLNIPTAASNVVALALGDAHALALRADGTVIGWGENSCGQTTIPTAATNIVRIAASALHSAAVRDDGTVFCWGQSGGGVSTVPTNLANVVEIAAGIFHHLALRANGTMVLWGLSFGSNTTAPPENATNVVAIAAGGFHNLALRQDGTLVGWGNNLLAQITIPASATNLVAITAGFNFSAALRADGTVLAWGQLEASSKLTASYSCSGYSLSSSGTGLAETIIPLPLRATNIVAIAAGKNHLLLLRADGELISVGDNSAGQANVPTLTNVIGIAAGGSQSLALQGSFAPQLGGFRSSRAVGESDSVLLNTMAAGQSPLAWQWLSAGTESNRTYRFFSQVLSSDAGNYEFFVTNGFGAITGQISLTVTASPPRIVTQPVGTVSGPGEMLTLSVVAKGSSPLTYQWRKNDVELTNGPQISGVASTNLVLLNAQSGDSGAYSVAITNANGGLVSSNAQVIVFSSQPLDTALDAPGFVWSSGGPSGWHWQTNVTHDGIDAGETGPFTTDETNWLETSVTGPVAISFWWRAFGWIPDRFSFLMDGVERLAVANDFEWRQRSYFVPAGTHTLRWSYACQPFAGTSTAWLDEVSLISAVAPSVTTPPSSREVTVGSGTTFSAVIAGTEPFNYQWRFNDQELSGATNATLTLSGIQTNQSGNYQLVITNTTGAVTSDVAVLTVNGSMPVLQIGPVSQTAAPGTSPALTSSFFGSTPMSLRWQRNQVEIPNAVGSNLVLSNLHCSQSGRYRVIASNEFGTAISAEAELTVVPVAAWGQNTYLQTQVPANVGDVVGISAGTSHNLALRRDGTIATWGSYIRPPYLNSPQYLPIVPSLRTVVSASDHDLGLRNNGTVTVGGLVNGGLSDVPPDLTNIIAVATSGQHDLALREDGTVATWGNNEASLNVPPDATNLVAIAAGGNVSLAVRDTGTLMGWGNNNYGQLTLPSGDDFVAVAAGLRHALALRADGTVVAWGTQQFDQLSVPPGLSNVVAIAAGSYHSLALRADGTVVAWGSNAYGQTNVAATLSNVVAVAGGDAHSLALVGDGRPVLTIPPQRRRLESGGSTPLQAFVVGTGSLAYQWHHDGTNVPGATNAILIVGVGGNYSVTVSNALGTVDSPQALVTATPPGLRIDNAPGALFFAADGLHFRLLGLTGRGPVVVLASSDFQMWTPILTNPPIVGVLDVVDMTATNFNPRFYRALEKETVIEPALRLIMPIWTGTSTGMWFRATLTGSLGSGLITVYGSTNLIDWSALVTNAPASGDSLLEIFQTNPAPLFWYRATEQR